MFSAAIVGVLGQSVTEVATIALGEKFGIGMVVVANAFAIMAMSTGFMGLGTALKETFIWDHKFPALGAKFLVISIPLALFLLGLRSFITILDFVGGFFISLEAIIMVLVFWAARQRGDSTVGEAIRHPLLIAIPVLFFFAAVMVFNIYTFII